MPARELGLTLTHEHALANFQPYEEWVRAPRTYDRDEVTRSVLPHLQRIAALGAGLSWMRRPWDSGATPGCCSNCRRRAG